MFEIVEDVDSAYDIIMTLKSQYQSTTAASTVYKLNKLLELKHREHEDISVFFGSVNSLIHQLKDSGEFNWDKLHVVTLLRGLPSTAQWAGMVNSLKAQEESSLSKEKLQLTLNE